MKKVDVKSMIVLLSLSALGWSSFGYGQDDDMPGHDGDYSSSSQPTNNDGATAEKSSEEDDNIIKAPKEKEAPAVKVFTKAETQKVCAKYQGKIISVYGDIYKIQNCVRHLVQEQENIFKFSRIGTPIVEVNATDVAAIPVGESWEAVNTQDRKCSTLNSRYVTFSFTDIYYVENCVRKLIPDYETYLSHKKSHGKGDQEVLALTSREFYAVKEGRAITSVIDKEFSKQLEILKHVDIIPIDEACKGVEGKIVTFHSRMYKIEKCRKREIDAQSYTMKTKTGDMKLTELLPEQWISMPDDKPFGEQKTEPKEKDTSKKN